MPVLVLCLFISKFRSPYKMDADVVDRQARLVMWYIKIVKS